MLFRRLPRLYWLELFALSQVLIVHAVLYRSGWNIGVRALMQSVVPFGIVMLAEVAAGVALRALVAWWTKDFGYFRTIREWRWLVTTVRLVVVGAMITHAYGWLKLMIPHVNPVLWDEKLWKIDQALFLGLSPNVFFLHVFSGGSFLQIIDWLYGNAFFVTLVGSTMIFLSLGSERIRLAYAWGSAVLWMAGAWLYIAVPSLGPAYAYPQVWEGVATIMRDSRAWQYKLLRNYQHVLAMRNGIVSPELSLFYGIAAFPSMHVAFQTYVALWVRRLSPAAGVFFLLGVVALFLGSVITGWHYLIDSFAGVLMAALCFWASHRLFGFSRWKR